MDIITRPKEHSLQSSDTVKDAMLWSITSKCRNTDCPLYQDCRYDEKDDDFARCIPELSALQSVHSAVISSVAEAFRTEEVLNDIGFKLMPLYQILIKLYMYHDHVDIVERDERGKVSVNPVLREIRSTVKDIDVIQKSIGLGGSYLRAAGIINVTGMVNGVDNAVGNTNYYDSLLASGEK